jgi:sugar lactone lactonase YvrE
MFLFLGACVCQSLVDPPYLHTYGIRRATPTKLFMFFGPLTSFDDPQGIAAAKMKSRDDPKTEDDDDELVVYGVNSGKNQLIYNTSMWTLGLYGKKGSGKDQFLSPRGIAIDADGNVYVADCGNGRVVHLFNPKAEVGWVESFTGKNETDPGLISPRQVALDRDGRLYVTDPGNRRIAVFASGGRISQVIPPPGRFQFEAGPEMLAVADGTDEWSFFRRDRFVFCSDQDGRRLWKIGFDGQVIKRVDLPAGHRAGYAAVDYFNNLWITDKENHCVLKYDHDLELLDLFGSFGTGKNQFVEPRGIAIWKRYGQTFIAEKKGAQYSWIGTECKEKSLRATGDNNYTLSLAVTEYSYVSLFNALAKDTFWVFKRRLIFAGAHPLNFRGDTAVMGGTAQLYLRIEPTYSSFKYYKWDYPIAVGR